MFVLDDLYVSTEVLDYLEETQHPVLHNRAALKHASLGRKLNIKPAKQIAAEPQRVITLSEMHLAEAQAYCYPNV